MQTLSSFGPTKNNQPRYYAWRDLTLSILDSGKWAKIPKWNLCHSGSYKKLKTGQESLEFSNPGEANEYLKKNYNLKVYGCE